MRTRFRTRIPSESSHGKFLRFIRDVAQMPYFTPNMEARYAFFASVRSIFNLWQVSIISMIDFHREHRAAADVSRFVASRTRDSCVRAGGDALPSVLAGELDDAARSQTGDGFRRGHVPHAAGVQQHHGLQLELPICSPRAVD